MEIREFLSAKTLEAIDWGVLDLSNVKIEKRQALSHFEFLLTCELEDNYTHNPFGIFRVSRMGSLWVYSDRIRCQEFTSYSLKELEKDVCESDNIWYVFDEELAREVI